MKLRFIRMAIGFSALLNISVADAMICRIWEKSSLDFGSYSPQAMDPQEVIGTLEVECTPLYPGETLNLQVKVDIGSLRMRNAKTGEILAYRLFQDAAKSQPIAGDVLFSQRLKLRVTTKIPITFYGIIPARQNVSAGTYRVSLPIYLDF